MARVEIVINARDNASSTIGGVSRSLKGLAGISFGALGDSLKRVGIIASGIVAAGVGAATVAVGKFVGSSVGMAMDLEAQMDSVSAILMSSSDELRDLSQLAAGLGMDPILKVTALEAAGAIEMLARNGVEATEILNGAARVSVLLSNAVKSDLSTSADVATDAMNLFNIEAKDMEDAVNGIVGVVQESKFGLNDYRLALSNGGVVASATGVSFLEFNAAIAATASAFRSGMTSGTALKTMMFRLTPSSDKAAEAMQELGIFTLDAEKAMGLLRQNGITPISDQAGPLIGQLRQMAGALGLVDETAEDADAQFQTWFQSLGDMSQNQFFKSDGTFAGMANAIEVLRETMGDLSDEEFLTLGQTIFGTEGANFALQLMQMLPEEYQAMMDAIENTSAEAAAVERMDNLAGAMEVFDGVVEQVKISLGTPFLGLLEEGFRFATDKLTEFIVALQPALDIITEFINDVNLTDMRSVFNNLIIMFRKLEEEGGPFTETFGRIKDALLDMKLAIRDGGDPFTVIKEGLMGLLTPEQQEKVQKVLDFGNSLVTFVKEHKDEIISAFKGIGLAIGVAIGYVALLVFQLVAPFLLLAAVAAGLKIAWDNNALGIQNFFNAIKGGDLGEFKKGLDVMFGDGVVESRIDDIKAKIQEFRDKLDNLTGWKADALDWMKEQFKNAGEEITKFAEAVKEWWSGATERAFDWWAKNGDNTKQALKNVGAAFAFLGAVLARMIGNVARGLRVVFIPILEAAQELLGGFAAFIVGIFSGNFGDAFSGLWEGIKGAGGKLLEAIKNLGLLLLTDILGIFGDPQEVMTAIADWFGNAPSEIERHLQNMGTKMGEKWSEFTDYIGNIFGQMWEGLKRDSGIAWDWIVKQWTRFTDWVKSIWNRFSNYIKFIFSEMATGLKRDAASFWQHMVNIWNWIVDGISAAWNWLVETLRTVWTNIKAGWDLMVAGVKTVALFWVAWMTNQFNLLKSGVLLIWDSLKTGITNLWRKTVSTIRMAIITFAIFWTQKFVEIKDFLVGEDGVFTKLWQWVVDNAPSFLQPVLDKLEEFLGWVETNAQRLLDFGKNLIQGIINGVGELGQTLVDTVAGWVSRALGGAEDEAGIESPSKVMWELGKNLILGAVDGVEDYGPKAVDAVRGVVERMTRAANASAADTMAAFANASVEDIIKIQEILDDQGMSEDTRRRLLATISVQTGLPLFDTQGNPVDLRSIVEKIGLLESATDATANAMDRAASAAILAGQSFDAVTMAATNAVSTDKNDVFGFMDLFTKNFQANAANAFELMDLPAEVLAQLSDIIDSGADPGRIRTLLGQASMTLGKDLIDIFEDGNGGFTSLKEAVDSAVGIRDLVQRFGLSLEDIYNSILRGETGTGLLGGSEMLGQTLGQLLSGGVRIFDPEAASAGLGITTGAGTGSGVGVERTGSVGGSGNTTNIENIYVTVNDARAMSLLIKFLESEASYQELP